VRGLRLVLLVLVVAAIAWASRVVDLGSYLSVDALRALVAAHAPYGPLVFIGVCIAGVFLHLPEIVFIALGGLVFETHLAFAYGWIASVAGATATFLTVRYLGRDYVRAGFVRRFARLRALDDRLARHGFATVLGLRVLLFMAPPLNWALGASSVRLPHYVAGTALGVVPGVGIAVFFADAIAAGEPAATLLAPRTVVAAGLVVALLASAAWGTRRLLASGRGPSA
jgi:uncharacterized membrane protein YdjX (TVP38/TMEM64 family)